MRRLRDTDGSPVHRRHIRFHLSSCKGLGALHDKLHDEATAAYLVLRDAERAREDAEDAAVTTLAARERAESAIENAIREIDAEAKKLDRKDPAAAARRTSFPAGITPILEPDGQKQLDVLPALRVRLEPFVGKGEMSAALAGLDSAEAELRAALGAVTAAEDAVAKAFALERAARRAVREQLESAHGRLRDHYKTRPAAAEVFFLAEKKDTKKKATDEPAEAHG